MVMTPGYLPSHQLPTWPVPKAKAMASSIYDWSLMIHDWPPGFPSSRAEKETKIKTEKIVEIRELTAQITSIKR